MIKQRQSTETTRATWRAFSPVTAQSLVLSLLLVGGMVVGCKGFWTDTQETMSDWYAKPNALEVVKSPASSPDRRAKFLSQLSEPLENGGNQQQQDEVIILLIDTATKDPSPYCRSQAIRKLGEFKDTRAVEAIQTAHDVATDFAPEVNSVIRQQSLKALAQTGSPVARAELIRVAKANAKENTFSDQQLTLDERLTAVRGLANFKDAETTAALVQILRTEKDIAMRNRVNESLQTVTGRTLPPDAKQWEQVLYTPGDNPAAQPKIGGPLQLIKGQK